MKILLPFNFINNNADVLFPKGCHQEKGWNSAVVWRRHHREPLHLDVNNVNPVGKEFDVNHLIFYNSTVPPTVWIIFIEKAANLSWWPESTTCNPTIPKCKFLKWKTLSPTRTIEVRLDPLHPHPIILINSFIFLGSKSGDDIALIKLQTVNGQGIQFNDRVQPICLPTSETAYQPGTLCSVSGWGMQKGNWTHLLVQSRTIKLTLSISLANDKESVPRVLQVASVPILAGETCIKEDIYGNFLSSDQFPESMVCAGYLEGKTDACSGDSGGPLACRINGKKKIDTKDHFHFLFLIIFSCLN